MAAAKDLELPDKQPCEIKQNESFDNYYDIIKEIGRGSFGVVKECIDKSTGSKYAAKFIRKTEKTKTDTAREIETMNKLRHKKLVQIENAFETRREMIIVMEFIPGIELFEKIAMEETPNLTEKQAIKYLKQILHGVNYMHKKSLVHMDLKPENILCLTTENPNEDEEIKLIDFGLAREVKKGSSVSVMCGTPEFVAPEVISYEPISTASDMWSLGVITYVLLSGISPFLGDDDNETFQNVTLGEFDFEDEDDVFETVSEHATIFIEDLLKLKPRERLTAEECLRHDWLKNGGNDKAIDKKYIRQFLAKRKWKKTITAIKAVGRFKKSSHSYLLRKTKSRLNNVGFSKVKPTSVFDVASLLKTNGTQSSKSEEPEKPEKPKNVFDVCNLLKTKKSEENTKVEKDEIKKPKSMFQVCNLLRETSQGSLGNRNHSNEESTSKINKVTDIIAEDKENNNSSKDLQKKEILPTKDITNNTLNHNNDSKQKEVTKKPNKIINALINKDRNNAENGTKNEINGHDNDSQEKSDNRHEEKTMESNAADIANEPTGTKNLNDISIVDDGNDKGKKVYDFKEMTRFIDKDLLDKNDNELKERAMRRKLSRDRKKVDDENQQCNVDKIEPIQENDDVETESLDEDIRNSEKSEKGLYNEYIEQDSFEKDSGIDADSEISENDHFKAGSPNSLDNGNISETLNGDSSFSSIEGLNADELKSGEGDKNVKNKDFIYIDDDINPSQIQEGIRNNFQRGRPRNLSERSAVFRKSNETEDIYAKKDRSYSLNVERLSLRKKTFTNTNGFLNNTQVRRQSHSVTQAKDTRIHSRLNFKDRLAIFQK